MNVTPRAEKRRKAVTRPPFNRPLFDLRLQEKGLARPVDAAFAFRMHRTDFYRLREGQLPGLHRGLTIAKVLEVDPLDLWPEPAAA